MESLSVNALVWAGIALDPFLHDINRSGMKWVIIVDEQGEPCVVLNANAFLRDALFGKAAVDIPGYDMPLVS